MNDPSNSPDAPKPPTSLKYPPPESKSPPSRDEDDEDAEHDPFDALLNLEDEYYAEGYAAGVADGERAGLIEGRLFGLQKGFEKGLEMGRVFGRAQVWGARVAKGKEGRVEEGNVDVVTSGGASRRSGDGAKVGGDLDELLKAEGEIALQPLTYSERLERHVNTLYALSEIESLDTRNTEEAVGEFDDRFKRAVAKAKVIESIIGDEHGDGGGIVTTRDTPDGTGSGEKGKGRLRLTRNTTGLEKNIEDFGIR